MGIMVFLFQRERIRTIAILYTSLFIRGITHLVLDLRATYQLLVCQEIAGVGLAVYFHTLDVTIFPIGLVRLDQHLLSVIQMELYGFEQRGT